MKLDDQAIAKVLRTRQDQAKQHKATLLELATFKSRIIDLVESFVANHPTHALISNFTVSLAEICQNALVGVWECARGQKEEVENALANRIFGLLHSKIVKNCSLPASCFLDSAAQTEQAMQKLVELSLTGSLADPAQHRRALQCNAECLSLFLRSLQHVVLSEPARLSEARAMTERVLLPALEDFEKKHTHVNSGFFEVLFTRTPLLCMALIPQLGKVVLDEQSKVKNYKRLEFVGLLRYLLRSANGIPTKDGMERAKEFLDVLQRVFDWAKERLENRQKEGFEDFRKLPRRRLLNEYCRLVEMIKAGGKKKNQKKSQNQNPNPNPNPDQNQNSNQNQNQNQNQNSNQNQNQNQNQKGKQKVKKPNQEGKGEKSKQVKEVKEKKEVSEKKEAVVRKNAAGKKGKGKGNSAQKVNTQGTR